MKVYDYFIIFMVKTKIFKYHIEIFFFFFYSFQVNAVKKSEEGLDNDFYSKPLDMDQRDKAFGSFVACELSDLRANPALYMKTKQAILKLLTEAHFEQMSSCKKS